jgi:multidrug efflux pump subunit AcrB/outer membrane protein TolC
MNLTRFSLRNPYTILALTLVVVALGSFAFWRVPTDLFPDSVPPQVVVVTVEPGATASDVADKITQVLEMEINTLSGLTRITSTSRDEVASINAEFLYEKPLGEAVVEVQNAIARVRGELPGDILDPRIYPITDANRPLVSLAVAPKPGSLKSLADVRLLAENDLKDFLLAVPGVADVDVFGGHQPEVDVRVDRDALAARQLTLAEVLARLGAQNVSAPAGVIYGSSREYLVRVAGEFPNSRALARLPISSTTEGGQVVLGDVAEVRLAETDPRSFYHGNGQPAIALNALRADGGNTVEAIRQLKAALPELERRFPDLAFAVTDDQQPIIDVNVQGMRASLWQAVALTVLVIFFFLADTRAAAVVGVSIPLSFLASLVVLWFSPYTLNMVTLSGLIIAVGMVVDASIVVTENVYRHHSGMEVPDARRAALEGTGEVSLAITAGMLTTVVVLVPVMFTHGFTGRLMKPLNLMIISTLVASLLISLTVVPILAARILAWKRAGKNPLEKVASSVGWAVDRLTDAYVALVRGALRHRTLFLVAIVLFVGVTNRVVKPLLGGEEMPPMDTGIAIVEFDTDAAAKPVDVEATLTRVEELVARTPGVEKVSSVVGSEPGAVSFGGGGATTQSARLTVSLVDRTHRIETIWAIEERWRDELRRIPGVRTARVSEYGATPVSTTKAPFDLILSGPDPTVLDRLADDAIGRLKGTPGMVDLRRSWYRDKPEIRVAVSPELARLYGTSPAAVARELRTAVQGSPASRLRLAGYLGIPIRVRYRASQVNDLTHLAEVPVPTRLGPVPLRALGTTTTERAAPFVTREGLRHTIDVTAGNQGLTIAQVTAHAEKRLAGLKLPAGYAMTVSGTARDMAEGQREMGKALVIGVVLLYVLLLAMFRSFGHPLTIMSAIPLAVAGAMWGLLAFDKPFCKPAFMGIILLGGTIVNNAILMLDFILEARRKGASKDDAIVQSVRLRLRPILMTAGSTIIGFSPLIFEMAVGLERMSPLGIAAGAGLLVGTVVTTVAVPVIYSVFDSLSVAVGRLFLGRKAASATATLLVAVLVSLTSFQASAWAGDELASPLSLRQAVAYALTHNPDLRIARADVERLAGETRSAQAAQGVQVDLTGSGAWTQEKHGVVPGTAGDVQRLDRWVFQAGAAARYLVWDFGKEKARVRSALSREEAGASGEARRRQEVTFEVSRLFLDTLAAEDLTEAARATWKSLEALVHATERLAVQGRVPRVDVLKVRVRLAQVESRIAALDAQKESLRAALAATLGLEGELPPLAYVAAREMGPPPHPSPERTTILAQRADVSARRGEVQANAESVAAARKDFLPRFDLQVAYNVYAAPDPEPVTPRGDDDPVEDDAFVGVQVRVPLFDGGLRRGTLHQAQARLEASRAALAKQRLQAQREILTALAEVESARVGVAANQVAVEQGQETLRVEQLKYDAGRGVVNDVLDAEAALLDARGLLRSARRQAEIAHLALDLALGRI